MNRFGSAQALPSKFQGYAIRFGRWPVRPAADRAAVLLVVALLGTVGVTDAAPPPQDDLVAMVIDAVRRNDSLIESAECTLREVLEDRAGGKKPVVVTKLPGGGETRVARWPRAEWTVRVALRGDDLRVDREPHGAAGQFGQESWAFFKGIWTHYNSASAIAWVFRPDGMPGMFPFDPRQLGSDEASRSVLAILREDRIVSAAFAESAEGRPVVRIVAKRARGGRTTYEFGQDVAFLPTRHWTTWPDGSVLQLVEIQYQSVLEGRAWFLKSLTRRFFDRGVTRTPSAVGWRQSMLREMVGQVVLNRPVADDRFQIDLPRGTRVSDNTRAVTYTAGPALVKGPSGRGWTVLWIVNLSILLVCVRVYRARTRNGRPFAIAFAHSATGPRQLGRASGRHADLIPRR